jgi:sugar phosphate isomerase/epimerase
MMEIGCSTICFRKLDVYEALARIGNLGFSAVDIGMVKGFCPHFDPLTATETEGDEFVERVSTLPLQIATLNVGHGALNIPAERDEQVEFVRRCMDLASRLGCYSVTCQPGVLPKDDWESDARMAANALAELADYAENLGLTLTIEAPHRGTLVTRVTQAKRLIELSGSDNLYMALDTSHVMSGGTQPAEAVEIMGDRIGHVHLRDAVGDDILMTPGDGEVDFLAFREALMDIGYGRISTLELEYEGKDEDQTAAEALRARNYLEKLWG